MEVRGKTVLVVIKANRGKGSLETLNWTLKRIVRPKDTIIALGYLTDCPSRKNPCFPFLMRLGISGLWERLEFPGQGEGSHEELDELEIEKKREQYGRNLQPFYQQCVKNEVNLELRLFSGICLIKLTVEEAKNSNADWIVLDSYLKNYKEHIKKKITCNLVVAKGKDLQIENSAGASSRDGDENVTLEKEPSANLTDPDCTWHPPSWRIGSPRAFDQSEIEMITNGFDEETLLMDVDGLKIYQGIWQDTPVLVTRFSDCERFQSQLNILSHIRHRNVMNIVGYCSTAAYKCLLCDHPNVETLEMHLQCDDLAMDFGWKARWCAALEVGGCLRYLHEECTDGPICWLSICSARVTFGHGYSVMIGNFATAKMLTDNGACKEGSPADCKHLEEDEGVSTDIRDYGILLFELVTGKSSRCFKAQGEAQSFVDWAIPLLENDSFAELMDSRLADSSDTKLVRHMANAALCCLKNVEGHRQSISEILAVVRGDDLALS